jgi:ABC-type multidrug transport system fused ATPase/permease subunit|tara:strand:- start:3758 stop:5494 length:1737 start_codon:yes stop_codon:yes gene_type:complete
MKNKNTFEKSLNLIKNKKQFYFLFFLSLIGVFVELLSVAIVIPVVVFLIEQDPIEKFQILKPIFNYLSISNKNEIISFSLFAIVIVYFFRFLFLIYLNYYKNLFSYNLSLNVKRDLIDKYLSQRYSYFFNDNSSRLIKNVIVEVSQFTGGAINSIFYIFIDLFVISTVLISLIFFEPIISFIIAIFLCFVGLILNSFSKGRVLKWGKLRFNLDQTVMKSLLEIFNSIREIKVFNKKDFFVDNFIKKYSPLGYLAVKQQTFYAVIKQSYEMVTLFAFCILVFYLSSQNYSNQEILTTIGIFAIAAFRLLPLFSRLLLGVQDIKFYLPSVNHLYEEFNELNKNIRLISNLNQSKNLNIKDSIDIKNISYSYDKDKKILDNISLKINKNDKIGIFGKSGSGKSTFVDIVFGLISPNNGSIYIDDKKLDLENDIFNYKLGYVSQSSYLLDDTVQKNIAFGLNSEEIDQELVLKSIQTAQMNDWLNGTKNGLETIIGENGKMISGGERQRIGIARTLYFDTEFIVLDEPTSSLDEETTNKFLDVLQSLKNKTIIMISHQKNNLSICNKIYEMKNGKLTLDEKK